MHIIYHFKMPWKCTQVKLGKLMYCITVKILARIFFVGSVCKMFLLGKQDHDTWDLDVISHYCVWICCCPQRQHLKKVMGLYEATNKYGRDKGRVLWLSTEKSERKGEEDKKLAKETMDNDVEGKPLSLEPRFVNSEL